MAFALSAVAGMSALASAGIGVETYGVDAPPAKVAGIFPMTAALFRGDVFVDTLLTPVESGSITFSTAVSIRQIGFGWGTWSHGYAGNAFFTNGATTLTMTLSPGFQAFQLYAEPNPFGVFAITATGSDGSTTIASTQNPDGFAGATGWGFYGIGGSTVSFVTLTSDIDFAVGEFATSRVPAPGGFSALGVAAFAFSRRRR